MPQGMGHVDVVGLTVALDDFARSSGRWAALLGQGPAVVDRMPGGRRRKRYATRSVAFMDLIEAGGEVFAGDCEIVLRPTGDFDARIAAIRDVGIPVSVDPATGDVGVAAEHANGVRLKYTRKRPSSPAGPDLGCLPYVFDLAVEDLAGPAAAWDAFLGPVGVWTPEDTDSARQYEMRHYVVDGESHAIGLMKLKPGIFIKRDSLGSSQQHILATHGEGLLCVGFLFDQELDAHIQSMTDDARGLLVFEAPRSYMMGANNMSHAENTGGVCVVIAHHYEGWGGDLHAAVEGTWRPPGQS